MNTDFPPADSQLLPQNDHTNDQSLSLNPGAPERGKRSGKICLWVMSIPVVCYICFMVYVVYRNAFGLRHPHRHLYYNVKGKGGGGGGEAEVMDRSQVVRPMITLDSRFDIVASVWVRDDSIRGNEDAVLRVDGEGRPERLVFTERIFRGLDVNGKMRSTDVKLRVPINHFRQANLSNYDLRASFVLVHSDENRPEWLDFEKRFTTRKLRIFGSPSVRKHNGNPTLEDRIYDSFGITIPLIEFHNITRNKRNANAVKAREIPILKETLDSDRGPDGEKGREKNPQTAKKWYLDTRRNSFKLEFVGDKQPVTEYHPYVVTRTHLRIMMEDQLFHLMPYRMSQNYVAARTCTNPPRNRNQIPEWYECHRTYRDNGVFETAVEILVPDDSESKTMRPEWLYAPYLSAMLRAAGPKDLVPIPVDREIEIEDTDMLESSDEGNITITWRLTFSGRTVESLLQSEGTTLALEPVYNMTEPEPMLQRAQHFHDYLIGLFDNIDENAHPRRNVALGFISILVRLICWILTVGYWYTHTTTTGISRLGTALLCLAGFLGNIEGLAGFFVAGDDVASWISMVWSLAFRSIIDLIRPLVMLVAIVRLEFSWLSRKTGGRGGGQKKKRSWIPRVRIAKATHSERTSERVEARIPRIVKSLLFVTAFAFTHYFITPNSYLIAPETQLPPEKNPLDSYFPNVPFVVNLLETLTTSAFLTGHVLQFLMNFSSQTYAGDYKITVWLASICRVIELLDLLPYFIGTPLKTRGVLVNDGVVLVITVVNLSQAVKYQYAKSLDGEDD